MNSNANSGWRWCGEAAPGWGACTLGVPAVGGLGGCAYVGQWYRKLYTGCSVLL